MLTEKQMREMPAPWPKTEKQLLAFVRKMLREIKKSKVDNEGYGKCVYAISLSSVATFNYVCHVIGATGFQAGAADLNILQRTRSMERFAILNYENLLYPQYACSRERFPTSDDLISKNAAWLQDKAKKLLRENRHPAPEVEKWWQMLAKLKVDKKKEK